MKHLKTVEIPATTKEVIDRVTCDLCGEVILLPADFYKVDEVTIKRRSGNNYPDGGCGTDESIDCCTKCWRETVIPFLRERGATVRSEEWNW